MKQPFKCFSKIIASALLVLLSVQVWAVNQGRTVADAEYIDLKEGVILFDPAHSFQEKAAIFLQEEVLARTGVRLSLLNEEDTEGVPEIILDIAGNRPFPVGIAVPSKSESFAIWTDLSGTVPKIILSGRDNRGLLYAAARLVRELYLAENYITLPADTWIASAPADNIRAQQILNNVQSEDEFMDWEDPDDLEKHINDLVLVGLNGIETTEPELVDEYMDNLDIDLYIKLKCQEIIDLDTLADEEIVSFYDHITGIDHITTYGGDASGAVRPQLFFPHMGRVIPLILKGNQGAKWWYSNQCLEDHAKDHDDYIFNYIQQNRPPWLYGMVYGPWTKRGIPEIREDLPSQYKLRHFPEICHPRWCQYPVPTWDRIFAIVWPRNNSIYAMPSMMRDIYLANRDLTMGSLPYNHTGTYNDLNKFTWVYAGWKPEASVREILEAYARLFFVHDFIQYPETTGQNDGENRERQIDAATDYVVRAFQLLEENWQVPLKDNNSAEPALEHWKNIAEWTGGPGQNWRVEMFLYKARIDAQIKRKYDLEMELEKEALQALAQAEETGFRKTIRSVEKILGRIDTEFQSEEAFLTELKSLGLSDKFGDLGEIADNIYTSFNDRYWILDRMEDSKSVGDLVAIVHYEDPGEGGFYDNLGVDGEQPHLVRPFTWKEDPGFVHSNINWVDNADDSDQRHSQHTHVVARYDTPLKMKWDQLDPNARYRIRVVYNGPFGIRQQCHTDEGILIHPFVEQDEDIQSFSIPAAATSDGTLVLQWTQDTSNIKRGVSVSEIWLEKETNL